LQRTGDPFCQLTREALARRSPRRLTLAKADFLQMSPQRWQKWIVWIASLIGGLLGLFAPVGVVKWLLQSEPEDAGILTLFFIPVWCVIAVFGLLAGRRLGLLAIGGKRGLQRKPV